MALKVIAVAGLYGVKLNFMHLNISEIVYREKNPQITTKESLNKFKLYSLLFNGQISMKEFLRAVQTTKDGNQKDG